jgi:hypothetical protein
MTECRKDDEEFLRECLATFQNINPERINVDSVVKHILGGLLGYSDTIREPGITHYVQVGKFLLSNGTSDSSNINIEIANDGEGGEFKQSDLEPVLKEFYDKHF